MIPQRIAVRGFLCYRTEQEVCFDSASLWMLSGANGSGKSALFDAVTYALFGGHRGGLAGAAALINKDCDSLSVEFDFLLENRLYQVRRTLKRTSKGGAAGTLHIRRWHAANAPDEEGCWEALADTGNKIGFDRWVREHIGLTYETFTSSVLLLQGKTEKLLASAPKERFEVLAGIVGLDRYQSLHKRADDRRRRLQAQAESLQHQLRALPEVRDTDLEEAQRRIEAAQAALHTAQAEVERWQSVSLALPLLRRLQRSQEQLRDAGNRAVQAADGERTAGAKVQQLEAEYVPLGAQLEKAMQVRQGADQRLTRTQTLREEIRRRVQRFQRLAGEKTCDSCGQPLTPTHIEAEKKRLQQARTAAENAYGQAVQARQQAIHEEKRLDDQRKATSQLLSEARQQLSQWQSRRQSAACEAQRLAEECTAAYHELPEPFRLRLAAEPPTDWLTVRLPAEVDAGDLPGKDAHFDPDQLKGQLQRARHEQTRCMDTLCQAQVHKNLLVGRRQQRQELEQRYLEVDQQHQRACLLAELLGRQRLQLHLVRRAERGIVDYANAVLDRLSGGQLFLCLGEEGSGDRGDQALQLEAYNRTAGTAPIDVAFLSGSQRFRVAVSLALGLGQYASRRHRPIEAVIIDEGFGCLDRQGRQVMVQELHNLKGQLRCILLVSHQEEIAEAFADGYRFELRDGTTVATRLPG